MQSHAPETTTSAESDRDSPVPGACFAHKVICVVVITYKETENASASAAVRIACDCEASENMIANKQYFVEYRDFEVPESISVYYLIVSGRSNIE